MATPLKSVPSLLRNTNHLSPRSPRLQSSTPNKQILSPVILTSIKSQIHLHKVEKLRKNIFLSNIHHEKALLLDSPHKRNLLTHGLNKKDLLSLLGRGSFGTVIKGEYKGEIVAVKLMKLKKPVKKVNELNGCNLIHKNINMILDVILSTKYCLVIMEYHKNSKCLQTILDETTGTLNEEVVIKWCNDISSGLQFCHVNSILHLDIKPQNILICDNNICKICDFGNSIKEDADDEMFKYQGTVAYTAPEILKGKKPSSKCDIYSLGILIWQLVSNKHPYEFLDSEVVIYKVVKFNFRPPLNFNNTHLSKLCCLCWDENPNIRPTASEVCDILSSV